MAPPLLLNYLKSSLLLFLVHLILLKGTLASVNRHAIAKRDSVAGDDEATRTSLEKRTQNFVKDRFDSDPILGQKVDVANQHSTYTDLQTDTVIYQREKADKESKAIALSSLEDKLPPPSSDIKRLHILLRRGDLEGTPKKYYPTLAYIVNKEKGDENQDSVTINGKEYCVEWAVWNDGVLNGIKYSFQYPACRYSILVSCKSNLQLNVSSTENAQKDKEGSEKKSIESKPPLVGDASFKSSPNQYLDFYNDLDVNKISGRMQALGYLFDLADKTVDGIASLWCSLSQTVLGQCHQYDAENGYTKSQIGTAVVRSDGQILAGGAEGGNGVLGTIINNVLPSNIAVPTQIVNEQQAEKAYAMGKRKKRSGDEEKAQPGWRTQYESNIGPNVIAERENNTVFYGLGNCPPKAVADSSVYNSISNPEEAISFFSILIRKDCDERFSLVVKALESEKLLAFSGKTFTIPETSSLLTTAKLNWIEEQKLASAFELHVLSRTYKQFKDNPDSVVTPSTLLDIKISKSVKFLEAFFIQYRLEVRARGRLHRVRLARHLIQVLQYVLEKLGEESRNLEKCSGDCSQVENMIHNDKLALMGIKKFIMHELPIDEDNIVPQLKDFIQNNQPAIEAALKEANL